MKHITRHNEATEYNILNLVFSFFLLSFLSCHYYIQMLCFILVTDVEYFFLCDCFRPKWDKNTSPEELKQAEKDNFLEWRRQLVR